MKNFHEISNLKYSAEKFETFWERYGAFASKYRDDKCVARFETHKGRDTGFSVDLHFNRYPGERDTGYFGFGSTDLALGSKMNGSASMMFGYVGKSSCKKREPSQRQEKDA